MIKTIRGIARFILFYCEKGLFELRCPVCGTMQRSWRDDPLCRECRKRVFSAGAEEGCRLCGNRIPRGEELCGLCLKSPPQVTGFRSFGIYDEEMRELIKAYKYGEVRRLIPVLVELLGIAFHRGGAFFKPDGVVIVPRYRPSLGGFYPMRGIAAEFCRVQRLPFLENALIKKKSTSPQASLTGKARLVNLKGAFAVNPRVRVKGQKFLLLDDVSTTGSTVRHAAAELHGAGAQVWVLVVAKAR